MRALVISLNGKKLCTMELTAGSRSVGLGLIGGPEGYIHLHAGGMEDRFHVNWLSEALQWGDEVTIQMVECDAVDPPATRKSIEEMDQWARSLGK